MRNIEAKEGVPGLKSLVGHEESTCGLGRLGDEGAGQVRL